MFGDSVQSNFYMETCSSRIREGDRVYLLIHLVKHLLNIYCVPGIVKVLRIKVQSLYISTIH